MPLAGDEPSPTAPSADGRDREGGASAERDGPSVASAVTARSFRPSASNVIRETGGDGSNPRGRGRARPART